MKLLIILFILKLYAQISIFKQVLAFPKISRTSYMNDPLIDGIFRQMPLTTSAKYSSVFKGIKEE